MGQTVIGSEEASQQLLLIFGFPAISVDFFPWRKHRVTIGVRLQLKANRLFASANRAQRLRLRVPRRIHLSEHESWSVVKWQLRTKLIFIHLLPTCKYGVDGLSILLQERGFIRRLKCFRTLDLEGL
jgi:hypothetical protein